MSLAAEHYRALEAEIPAKRPSSADEVAATMRKLIADTQQLTLSQMDDSIARQLGSILFSHEAGLISALSCVEPPEIKREKGKTKLPGALVYLVSLLISAACALLAWELAKPAIAILAGLAAVLAGVAVFLPKGAPDVKVSQSLNADALIRLGERRMEAIDRDMEAFLSLPAGETDADEGVLRLISKAITLKREDPDSVPDELMTAITALTLSRGYTLLEYAEGGEAYFDVMPTKRQTRTIVPAVLQGDKLVARGMAIVQMDETAEEA